MPKVADGKVQRKITETRTEQVDANDQRQDDPYMMWRTSPHDQEFFEMLSQIPEEDWQKRKLGVTVYRLDPPVDPQNPDRAGHAFNKSSGFDEAYVYSRYGGGRYGYWFREGSKVRYRNSFFIGGQPKHPREWEMEGTKTKEAAQTTPAGDGGVMAKLLEMSGAKAVNESHEILSAAFKKAVETLGDKKEDPLAMLELFMKFQAMMQPQQSRDPLLEKLLLKFIDRDPTPPQADGPVAKLQEKLLERFLEKMDNGDLGDSSNPWAGVVSRLAEAAPGIAEKIASAASDARKAEEARIARAMMMRGARIGVPQQPPEQPSAEQPAQQQAANPAQPGGLNIGEYIKIKLLEMLYAGDPGDEAALVIDKLDPDFAQSLKGMLERQEIDALKSDPVLRRAFDHPNVMQFARDYVNYFSEEKEEPETVEAA